MNYESIVNLAGDKKSVLEKLQAASGVQRSNATHCVSNEKSRSSTMCTKEQLGWNSV